MSRSGLLNSAVIEIMLRVSVRNTCSAARKISHFKDRARWRGKACEQSNFAHPTFITHIAVISEIGKSHGRGSFGQCPNHVTSQTLKRYIVTEAPTIPIHQFLLATYNPFHRTAKSAKSLTISCCGSTKAVKVVTNCATRKQFWVSSQKVLLVSPRHKLRISNPIYPPVSRRIIPKDSTNTSLNIMMCRKEEKKIFLVSKSPEKRHPT